LKFKVTTNPTWWPLSLEEAKTHLRVSNTSEDGEIWTMVKAATEMVERETWTQLNQKGLTFYFDNWENFRGSGFLPIISVDSIKYYDENNDIQTLPAADYETDLNSDPVKIDIDSTPNLYDRYNAVEIALTVGYAEACDIPNGLISCIKMVLGDLYENRQNQSPVNIYEIPRPTRQLMMLYSKKEFV